MKTRKWIYIAGVVLLLVGLVASLVGCGAEPTPEAKGVTQPKIRLLVASGSTTSSVFLGCVATCKVWNEYAPHLTVDIITIPGTEAKLEALRKGTIKVAAHTATGIACEAYHGVGTFKGKPPLDFIRVLHPTAFLMEPIVVRADSGIASVKDLDGKPFHAGSVGTATYEVCKMVLDHFGIHPNYFIGSLGDAVRAIKDRRIVGFCKSCPGMQLDGSMLEIQAFTPIKILPWTKEQMQKALELSPGLEITRVPAGIIDALPTMGEFWVWGHVNGTVIHKDIPEYIGYEMIKAICEHWDTMVDVMPSLKGTDPVAQVINTLVGYPPDLAMPVHSGVVKYFKEIGVKVPANLVPIEYKE